MARLRPEAREKVARELQRFFEVAAESLNDRTLIRADLAEIAIVQVIRDERNLSHTQTFELWQLGIANQSEEWWARETADLSEAAQRKIRDFRKDLRGGAAAASSDSPSRTPAGAVQLSEHTQSKIVKFNKLSPDAHASEDFAVAMQAVEDSAHALEQASEVIQTALESGEDVAALADQAQLRSLQRCAKQLLAAMQRHREQTVVELRRTRFTAEEQQQVVQSTATGHQLMQAWAGAALQAADAGLTAYDLANRKLPNDSARRHFADTWAASLKAQEQVIERAATFTR